MKLFGLLMVKYERFHTLKFCLAFLPSRDSKLCLFLLDVAIYLASSKFESKLISVLYLFYSWYVIMIVARHHGVLCDESIGLLFNPTQKEQL